MGVVSSSAYVSSPSRCPFHEKMSMGSSWFTPAGSRGSIHVVTACGVFCGAAACAAVVGFRQRYKREIAELSTLAQQQVKPMCPHIKVVGPSQDRNQAALYSTQYVTRGVLSSASTPVAICWYMVCSYGSLGCTLGGVSRYHVVLW